MRHWERRDRLLGDAKIFGSATKALSTALKFYGPISDEVDPVLFLNAADEFLERGYTSETKPKDVEDYNLENLLIEAEARMKSSPFGLGIKISRLTLNASRLMNDGKLEDAEHQLMNASLMLPMNSENDYSQSHRGLRLIRGKIELLRGNPDNEYLDMSRQICMSMGAFHKVKEIDTLIRLGNVERPS